MPGTESGAQSKGSVLIGTHLVDTSFHIMLVELKRKREKGREGVRKAGEGKGRKKSL